MCACVCFSVQEGNVLAAVRMRDKKGGISVSQHVFRETTRCSLFKNQYPHLRQVFGLFSSSFFLFIYFFFLQGWHSPRGYNHLRPSKFKSNKPSHKGLHKGVAMLVFSIYKQFGSRSKPLRDEHEKCEAANLCAARR